jgi:hypothetical protein
MTGRTYDRKCELRRRELLLEHIARAGKIAHVGLQEERDISSDASGDIHNTGIFRVYAPELAGATQCCPRIGRGPSHAASLGDMALDMDRKGRIMPKRLSKRLYGTIGRRIVHRRPDAPARR